MEYTFELDRTSGEMPKRVLDQIEDVSEKNREWDYLLKKYNIYDLRKILHLYDILPTQMSVGCKCDKTAVIVNLFYEDQVQICCNYLTNVPPEVDIYLCTSKKSVFDIITQFIPEGKKCKIILKENRGRDISALLVACKEYIDNYEYICFVHDKKSYQFAEASWAESWFYSMWENTLPSEAFIRNVIQRFKSDEKLGLLTIPEPFHGCYYSFIGGLWGRNFEVTVELCSRLKLDCNIDIDKQPITLGTVFWCRRKALAPLFEYDFRYEDFPEEPMNKDGTISHAIERALGYIAQAGGYYTSTLMSDQYGALRVGSLYEMMLDTTLALRTYNSLKMPSDVCKVDTLNRKVGRFCKQYKKIYVYGAGQKGQRCVRLLRQLRVNFNGYVVSDGYKERNRDCKERIYELHEIVKENNFGIIIALNEKNAKEAEELIRNAKIEDILYF